jgi:hypothetical protein
VRHIVSTFLAWRADALSVLITLQLGDPSEQMQRFDAHRKFRRSSGARATTERKMRAKLLSRTCHRASYVARTTRWRRADTALRWGTVGEVGEHWQRATCTTSIRGGGGGTILRGI